MRLTAGVKGFPRYRVYASPEKPSPPSLQNFDRVLYFIVHAESRLDSFREATCVEVSREYNVIEPELVPVARVAT